MLEYVFFDEDIRDKFVEFLRERSVEVECNDEEGCIAAIPEDLDEELADDIPLLAPCEASHGASSGAF